MEAVVNDLFSLCSGCTYIMEPVEIKFGKDA